MFKMLGSALSVLLAAGLIFGAGFLLGTAQQQEKDRQVLEQALEVGAAEYTCNPKTGEVRLTWNGKVAPKTARADKAPEKPAEKLVEKGGS